MPRIQISIKLDEDVLARLDRLAEDTGYSRTAIIEQAVKADLPEREAFQRSLENPILRTIHKRVTTPSVLRAIAALANEDMTDEDLADILQHAPKRRESGKRRQEDKQAKKSSKKEDA
jgi:predicted DNA-binding protein